MRNPVAKRFAAVINFQTPPARNRHVPRLPEPIYHCVGQASYIFYRGTVCLVRIKKAFDGSMELISVPLYIAVLYIER